MKRLGRMRPAVLAGVAMLAAAIGVPAQGQGIGFYTCNGTLNLVAGSGHTVCAGAWTGYPATPADSGSFVMSYEYVETGCPLTETGSGSLALDSSYFADVEFVRVGTQVTIVLSGGHAGAAVAEWTVAVADLGPGLCSDSNVEITMTGVLAGV